jgi:hypothetical protein
LFSKTCWTYFIYHIIHHSYGKLINTRHETKHTCIHLMISLFYIIFPLFLMFIYLVPVCFCILKAFLKNLNFFYFFLQINIFFSVFRLFWCVDVENNFLKIKNIILIYFRVKNTLKNNRNHTLREALNLYIMWEINSSFVFMF